MTQPFDLAAVRARLAPAVAAYDAPKRSTDEATYYAVPVAWMNWAEVWATQDLEDACSEIERLRAALAFYANLQNWNNDSAYGIRPSRAENDAGARARAALTPASPPTVAELSPRPPG